ncbi:MAG: IS110 family transposase [Trebonia sp.]
MTTPSQVSVWIGLDVGKESHFADVLDNDGERLFSRAVGNDQADIEMIIDRAAKHGVPGLAIDQPGSIAQLILAVAAARGVPVAYIPGLVMRRAADLYPGEAKTDRRDAYIIADTARTRRKQVHWLDASSDELLAQLRVLNGFDTDLAADQTRVTNRLRDALTSIAPALERAIGPKLHHAGVRDLAAAFPAPAALRAAGPGKIRETIPPLAAAGRQDGRRRREGPGRARRHRPRRGRHRARHRRAGRGARPRLRQARCPGERDQGGVPRPPFR